MSWSSAWALKRGCPVRARKTDPQLFDELLAMRDQQLAARINQPPSALSCAVGPHQQGTAMNLSKREQSRIERTLAATLTDACEAGKAEIVGFQWLTHDVDYQHFPASLRVIWIFASQAEQDAAIARGQDRLMQGLTATALQEAAITLETPAAHVHLDNEQQCLRVDGGNWQQRLSRQRSSKR
jgi:hypothetical protein